MVPASCWQRPEAKEGCSAVTAENGSSRKRALLRQLRTPPLCAWSLNVWWARGRCGCYGKSGRRCGRILGRRPHFSIRCLLSTHRDRSWDRRTVQV